MSLAGKELASWWADKKKQRNNQESGVTLEAGDTQEQRQQLKHYTVGDLLGTVTFYPSVGKCVALGWQRRNPLGTAYKWTQINPWQSTWICQLLLVLDDGNPRNSSNHSNPNHLQANVQPFHHCVAGKEAALVLLQTQLILQLKPVRHTTEVCTTQIPLLLPQTKGIATTL